LIGGYIKEPHESILAIEFVEGLIDDDIDCIATQILLFTLIEASKTRLNQSDPLRKAMERSEYLGELFVRILEK